MEQQLRLIGCRPLTAINVYCEAATTIPNFHAMHPTGFMGIAEMNAPGPDNAWWDDGEWISWGDFGDEEDDNGSHLAKLEREAELKHKYPNADIALIPFFTDLLGIAESYYQETGKHLQVYGDIGELFGAITYGIKLHRNYAQGSDGRLGDDFVEIKTITPFNTHNRVNIRLTGNFGKLLVVKVNADFRVSGRLIDRKQLPKSRKPELRLSWDSIGKAS